MKYNNLKDVFFDSKFHVGKGLATYDSSLNKSIFDALATIDDVMNNQAAVDAIVLSEKTANAIINNDIGLAAIKRSEIAKEAFNNANITEDPYNSPGTGFIIGGNIQQGFFGVVPASELITGVALASLVGISQGTSQFSDEGWLKFAYQGKIQFVAKKPIRHSISWDAINTADCVFGTKTVKIGGLTYKVRLMRTGLKDPVSNLDGDMHGSEWNKLMLPIHIEAKDKSWAYPAKVEADIPYWGIDFTDGDLHTHNSFGNGSFSWCQETYSSSRVYRGGGGVSYSYYTAASTTDRYHGWRPVLELVA